MLFIWNEDRPGMIGQVGTVLGRHHVNIANMHVGRRDAGGTALMVLTLDAPAPPDVIHEIGAAQGIAQIKSIRLSG
jgi:D-3-phosphoglycerate dehydrogenase